MPSFSWTFDAPTGTYKSHAMSMKLYEAAVANSIFLDHVSPAEGFGKNKGETVTLVRVRNIAEPGSADLDELTRIPEDEFDLSTKLITVKEIGRAVPYTSLSQDLSEFNIENPIQSKLRDQMRLVLDTKASAGFKKAQVKATTTSATAITFTTNGAFSGVATNNWTVEHVELIRDYMFDTIHVPPLEGDVYLSIVRTKGLRGLKAAGGKWEEWHKYTDPQAKFTGEVGQIEAVRFIESNHSQALSNFTNIGEGVVFGQDAVAIAEAMTPELRAAIPDDFGRAKAVAWYGILEFDIIWDTANDGEARIVHMGSTS